METVNLKGVLLSNVISYVNRAQRNQTELKGCQVVVHVLQCRDWGKLDGDESSWR